MLTHTFFPFIFTPLFPFHLFWTDCVTYCCTSHYISPLDNTLCHDKKGNHLPCHQTHPSGTTKSRPSARWPGFLVFLGGILLINEHPRNQNASGSASYIHTQPCPHPTLCPLSSVLIKSPVKSIVSTRKAYELTLFYHSFLLPFSLFIYFGLIL